ncbi:glycosyltransferase [Allostreptomyces psammosilenae]|uniref:D-inositol 3-phosphate glycosyltransferase n=1 Tax=Allostreptomyces psammosilenae TaxID=1892865 RepID=A0A852ZZD5_9ACTN|nr:glycosyltransferase [Allostreptomyces psammosilenae]NYI07455.1 glycosyltransferase involved in cell wall biosynthesis [Allostreptomyces psammosilenae]
MTRPTAGPPTGPPAANAAVAAGAGGAAEAGAARPVRVLWLAKGLGRGGAERLLVNCARHVDTARWQIEVAYLLPHKDALVAELAAVGVPVHRLGRTGRWGLPDLGWPWRLRRLVRERGYRIVHTHMPVPAVAARLFAGRGDDGRLGVVHTEHNVWERYRLATRLANAVTYRRNDAVIAVSRAVAATVPDPLLRPAPPGWRAAPGGSARAETAGTERARAETAGGESWGDLAAGSVVAEGTARFDRRRLTVIHHGPDRRAVAAGPAARARGRRLLGLPEDVPVVGTVGNLTPKKDQATLVRAHALLRREHPRALLVLVGSGPLERELRRLAERLEVAGSVVFAGSRADVPLLLPAFDAFALSSRQEGLPVALMEAMTAGVPPVVTRVGGVPEVVRDGVEGLLVPAGSPSRLAAALDRVLGDAGRRAALSEAARARSASFDVALAQRRVESVYERVLASPR